MAVESCLSALKEQQLYKLELLVDRLNLSPEKIREIGSDPLSVRLEFVDFPTFDINENEFWSEHERVQKQTALSSERSKTNGCLDFSAGKSCLFPKRPNELVAAMRNKPLRVGVYKVTPKIVCGPQKQETPVCQSEIPLSGCLCDQVAMAGNDVWNLPKPYTLHNTWNLIDDQGTPSGTILLSLRLTCLGKSIVKQFAMQENSFLFKSPDSPNEFQCTRVPPDVGEEVKGLEKIQDKICVPEGYVDAEADVSPKPRSVIGLASICQELIKRDGGPLETVPALKLSNHRQLDDDTVLKSHKNEVTIVQGPLCSRQPECNFGERVTDEFPCGRSICTGGVCAGPRIKNPLPNDNRAEANLPEMRIRRSERNEKLDRTANYFYESRMRGGGPWDQDFDREKNDYSKYSNERKVRIPEQSVETLIVGACKSDRKNETAFKPGCGCYGKLGTGSMGTKLPTKNGSCSNKPCHGVDCLIRAFKETQDFVNSIGKVPGMAGLGLMDPAESPFFGRQRDDDIPTSCAEKNELLATSVGKRGSNDRNAGWKTQRVTRRFSEGKAIDTILPAPGTGHVTLGQRDPRTFHADTVSLASAKSKKKGEDKIEKHKDLQESSSHQPGSVAETGPCGAQRCKSRKKKLSDQTFEEEENWQLATKKSVPANKLLNLRKSRTQGKSKSYANLGPAGYRLSGQRNSCIRVSRRIMRLVNAMRNPRFRHGHRTCLDVRLRVPGNMGWLWNTGDIPGRLKPSIGWKPGAISKFVWDRLQQAKAATTAGSTTSESRPATPGKGKRGRSLRSIKSFHSSNRSPWAKNMLHEDERDVELPPTLHIHRKDGTYYVTMYPIDAKHINEPELQEKTKPLQFKITKDKKDKTSACSSSSASDMEFEFSPPAAINRYRQREPGKSQDTQVNQQEILDTFKLSSEKLKSSKKSKKEKIKK